uniref:Sister chromatid cohesion protein PDS5 homolog A n=1 Tax=Heterorhabditis bacteriophora TaxID=37862 RepID=A0A1I7XSU8_HETBA
MAGLGVEYPPNCPPITLTNNNSELVKRLKTLSETLQNSDSNDECGLPNRYGTLIEHLSNSHFLNNNSREVQIWLACCLADILRVFAPNIPLGDPGQLRNLSVMSTLLLALELPSDEAGIIIRQLIKTALEITNGKEWKKEKEREKSDELNGQSEGENEEKSESKEKAVGMIAKLLRDVDQVSNGILDALFFFLINPQKLNNRESFHMARNIIQTTQTSLEAAIQSVRQFNCLFHTYFCQFNMLQLLTQSLLAGGLPPECDLVGSTRSKLHEVILELHEIAPELVSPVLPQVSSSLRAEDDGQRLLATKLVGMLATGVKSRLYDDNPSTWQCYLDRFKDCSAEIRETCAKHAHEILLNHSQIRGQVSAALERLTRDVDDSVRLTAIQCVVETARKKLEAISESLILACCERMRDKKPKIRQEALTKLLHLHSKVACGEEYTMSDRQVVAIIPQKALSLYMLANMNEEKLMIERYFVSYIIPYKMEMRKRMKWMIELHYKLDKYEAQAFADIISRSSALRRILREMLEIISRDGKGEDKARDMQAKIQRVAAAHHDPNGFSQALKHFTNLLATDQRCFECAEYIVSNDYSITKVESLSKELVQRAQESGSIGKDSFTHVRRFVERIAPLIMDTESAAEFVRCVFHVKGESECGKLDAKPKLPRILRLLRVWGEHFPHLFSKSDCVRNVIKLIQCDDAQSVETGLQVLLNITSQTSLKAKELEWYDDAVKSVWSVVNYQYPDFGRAGKLAVRVTCKLLGKEECSERFPQIFDDLMERVSMSSEGCVNALQVLSQFHHAFPHVYKEQLKDLLTKVVVPKLILSPETDIEDVQSFDPIVPMERQPMPKYCMPKVYAMKLLTRFLFTSGGDAEDDALAKKTLNLFVTFVDAAGDLHDPERNISQIEKARLRAVAGACVLKLCYLQKYVNLLGVEQFITVANLVADVADCVRTYFVRRLHKGLVRNRFILFSLIYELSIEFMALFSLVGLIKPLSSEEEVRVKQFRDLCRGFLSVAISRRRALLQSGSISPMLLPYHQPEYVVAYSIFLLTHQSILLSHADSDSLATLQECLWFVMEPFAANKECYDFEFIYRLMQDVKEANDALSEGRFKKKEIGKAELAGQNKKMWALADLGMLMVVYRAKIAIRNEPRKTLPSKRFFLPTNEANSTIYAPADLIKDEKDRNGRPPVEKRRGLNGTTMSNKSNRGGKNQGPQSRNNVHAPSKKIGDAENGNKEVEPKVVKRRGKRSNSEMLGDEIQRPTVKRVLRNSTGIHATKERDLTADDLNKSVKLEVCIIIYAIAHLVTIIIQDFEEVDAMASTSDASESISTKRLGTKGRGRMKITKDLKRESQAENDTTGKVS